MDSGAGYTFGAGFCCIWVGSFVADGSDLWRCTRVDGELAHAEPVEAMRGANREVGRSGRHWAQKALVIAQVTVSLVLLSAAAMLGGSLRNLEHQNFGFDPGGALSGFHQ